MATERFFVFIYPEDHRLQELLDLAIYILNPNEKWPAHVTLAGPYKTRQKLPHSRVITSTVRALGVGAFRSEHQNTIYLRVGAEEIKDFWDKPDFSGNVIPHLTIYDGPDDHLADLLYAALDELRLFFFFHVSEVQFVSSVKGQYQSDLLSRVNTSVLAESSNLLIRDIGKLSLDERIRLSILALRKAKYYLNLEE